MEVQLSFAALESDAQLSLHFGQSLLEQQNALSNATHSQHRLRRVAARREPKPRWYERPPGTKGHAGDESRVPGCLMTDATVRTSPRLHIGHGREQVGPVRVHDLQPLELRPLPCPRMTPEVDDEEVSPLGHHEGHNAGSLDEAVRFEPCPKVQMLNAPVVQETIVLSVNPPPTARGTKETTRKERPTLMRPQCRPRLRPAEQSNHSFTFFGKSENQSLRRRRAQVQPVGARLQQAMLEDEESRNDFRVREEKSGNAPCVELTTSDPLQIAPKADHFD